MQSRFDEIVRIVNERLAPMPETQTESGVNVSIGGITVTVPARRVGNRWILSLPDGPEGQPQPDVLLRVLLETMGFSVGWDGNTNTITATVKNAL